MSQEIELAVGSVEAALAMLVRESGVLSPVKLATDYLAKRLYYRQLPILAR